MGKVSRIWLWFALVLIGYSGGIITGVVVDVDTKYETVIKNLKQKKSPGGTIVVDVETTSEQKSRKELRQDKKDKRQGEREIRRAAKQK